MSLHRAVRSDWSSVPPQERNSWQRLAAASHGVIAPGNLISLTGGVLVIAGLYMLSKNQLLSGMELIFVGRLADVLDGIVADHTKTKSPLGEGVDASIDKILIAAALIVLLDRQLLPLIVGITMALHAVYVTVVSTVGRRLKVPLHPSRSGKFGAAFEWLCVGLYLLAASLKQHHEVTSYADTTAIISFGLFVIGAFWSSLNYTRNIYYKQVMD